MEPTWTPAPGFDNYEVSRDGRIRNRNSRRVLAVRLNTSGHVQVALYQDGQAREVLLHRLLLETFVGPAPTGKNLALHNDGDPLNNEVRNLRWGDQSENMQDRIRHGRGPTHNSVKTHCRRGHEYDEANTRHHGGKRICRACDRLRRRTGS